MPFCPDCHWEYIEGTKNCSDCGKELIAELEVEKFPEDIETAKCYIADDEIEAEIVKDLLHQNNIPCIMTSQYSHFVHPFSHIGASGEVAMLVPTSLNDEALQIIKDYQAEKGVVIDNEFANVSDNSEGYDDFDESIPDVGKDGFDDVDTVDDDF